MRQTKRPEGERCWACERPLKAGQAICPCGTATRFMSFEERARFEVERWRHSRHHEEAQAG